jgi:hypothetical protein
MLILITTLGRATKHKAIAQIPEALHQHVRVFTQEAQADEYRQHLPSTIQLLTLPDDTDGIAQTRQRAIDALPKGKVWVIDDLCIFKKRTITTDRIIYEPVTAEQFTDLYESIEMLLERFIQVGVSSHNGNNRIHDEITLNNRAYSTYGLRTDIMARQRIEFDAMYKQDTTCKYMEDFYITLDALTKGYANCVIYDYCFLYAHNTAGGNSTNRTLEGHAASAAALAKRFPLFVRLTQKEGKWGTQQMDSRTEVTVQWKKAYQHGMKRTK